MSVDARLSGLIDAVRVCGPSHARVLCELRYAMDLAGLTYTSNETRPVGRERSAWREIAHAVCVAMHEAEIAGARSGEIVAAKIARARSRRWDHHVSVVDLTWESVA